MLRERDRRAGTWITKWSPDDETFWWSTGRRVARRNLVWSIFAEHLGFTVWTLWSVVAVELGSGRFTTDQLFWLIALPSLVGSIARVPYTFAPARFGGRNWTVASVLLLLIPTGLLAVAVSGPATPYWAFLAIAATAGIGGGNFASSMANITHFYPEWRQGTALGLNAAGGNIGVSTVQVVVPLAIAGAGLAGAGLVWVPFILLAAAGAYFRMDNLAVARSGVAAQLRAARRAQTWVMSIIYIGTFGSFIGYATALPLLTKTQFPDSPATRDAFFGAMAGSLSRPLGGWLSDRFGGARVTSWIFLAMGLGVATVAAALALHSYAMFLAAFLVLFITAGIGNGSTYRMIPAIFTAKALEGTATAAPAHAAPAPAHTAAVLAGKREAAAALGIISAAGAIGGFLINRGFGMSIGGTHGAEIALIAFAAFYGVCLILNWWCYLRRRVALRLFPSLAYADV